MDSIRLLISRDQRAGRLGNLAGTARSAIDFLIDVAVDIRFFESFMVTSSSWADGPNGNQRKGPT